MARSSRVAAALSLALVARPAPAPAQAPPSGASQKSALEAGPVVLPLEVREQFLGRSGEKTVVRFVIALNRGDVKQTLQAAPRVYSFVLTGEASTPEGKPVETFRVPVELDLTEAAASKPLEMSFLRPLPPGPVSLAFRLEAGPGRTVAVKAVALNVPAMSSEFRVEDAGAQPSAAAILLEAENRPAPPKDADGLVKLLAPSKEVPVGLLRIEAQVKPPVERVEFWLEDKKILAKNRPPYTVEVDLGTIPRRQTLKALGFDRQGNFLDADAWAINERDARLAVRLVELPKKGETDATEFKVSVQSVAGGVMKGLKLFVDDQEVKSWTVPPFLASVPKARLAKATLVRATATDEDGKEFTDLKFLKGDSRFLSKVEVNLVELNVTVLDGDGRVAKGLTRNDVTVLEDGKKQEISAFEFSESLPISLGIVIDGSGSMKDAMKIVHEAAGEFVSNMIGEKDQGFVVEFREAPTLLTPMTKSRTDLMRAVRETRADGATALYDSIVLALYQFRAVPGRKALVILSDGKDNHSWTEWDTLRRYTRTAGVPIFVIGLDLSIFDVGLKSKLKDLSADTGAETFFVGSAKELPDVYKRIETDLRSQYFISYLTDSKKPEDQYRTVELRLGKPGLKARTIRGYFP